MVGSYDGPSRARWMVRAGPDPWHIRVSRERRDHFRMTEIDGWDDYYGAVRQVIELVNRRLPLMTTSHAHDAVRQVPAAYLARCRRLLVGMDLFRRDDLVDLVGVLMRVLFE